jgi:hypothetical protein
MKLYKIRFFGIAAIILSFICPSGSAQNLDAYRYNGELNPSANTITNSLQFNGYTNYWHDIRHNWYMYGNLFKLAANDINYTIAQSKRDIADDMNIPGLSVQEGFLSNLFTADCQLLDQPSLQQVQNEAGKHNVLVLTEPGSEAGKILGSKIPTDDVWKDKLKSHQLNAADYTEINAFFLENGTKRIFVISSKSKELRQKVLSLIDNTKSLLDQYDLRRGWFGAGTLLKSVTIAPGHPLEVIGRGMSEGNTWFTFSGYMDYLIQNELDDWLARVNLQVAADVGAYVGYVPNIAQQAIYGCKNYDGLQPQNMYTVDSWLKFAQSKGGYAFRSVYDRAADMYHYDGYIAGEGNKEQIDNENVPFVTTTGYMEDDAVPCMVLFTKKGEQISKQLMWQAIMERREVAVLGNGKMMGPAHYRNALELLLLDRVFLEEYFGDRVVLEANTKGYQLNVIVSNTYSHAVSGTLQIVLPSELRINGELTARVDLPAGGSRSLIFELKPAVSAMAKTNPIAVHYKWEGSKKSTLTMLDLPPAISVHQLLYGQTPSVSYPVSVHNFTSDPAFPVRIEVLDRNNSSRAVFTETKTCTAETGKYSDLTFDLKVPPGSYSIKVTALGTENISQLGVGKAEGSPKLTLADLNNDGVDEYIMENDSVKVTLLTTGARIIEYFVKSRNDNVLFKLWPEKPADAKREYRKRNYYPYGGFEDFLGQASMETHKVYTPEIIKKDGNCVSVRMTADYFGNRLEKTFTLYGNSPLVEVRYAFDFINPEANVIAPVPILVLGKKHGTEDIFTVPEKNGLKEYRMEPEIYVGQVIFPAEGWDAGYDPFEDISFVGAFPVSRPLFLHMFQNLATNGDAHYDFNEFQPWVPIIQKTTSYFTYYLWGSGGKWQNGLKELKDRNLISVRDK